MSKWLLGGGGYSPNSRYDGGAGGTNESDGDNSAYYSGLGSGQGDFTWIFTKFKFVGACGYNEPVYRRGIGGGGGVILVSGTGPSAEDAVMPISSTIAATSGSKYCAPPARRIGFPKKNFAHENFYAHKFFTRT